MAKGEWVLRYKVDATDIDVDRLRTMVNADEHRQEVIDAVTNFIGKHGIRVEGWDIEVEPA